MIICGLRIWARLWNQTYVIHASVWLNTNLKDAHLDDVSKRMSFKNFPFLNYTYASFYAIALVTPIKTI